MGRGLQVPAAAVLGGMLLLGAELAFAGERASDRVGGTVFLTVLPVMAWLFFVRPFVELSASSFHVQNPLRSHHVPVGDVMDVTPLSSGLGLELRDGTQVNAWALQQGLLVSLLRGTRGRTRRAV